MTNQQNDEMVFIADGQPGIKESDLPKIKFKADDVERWERDLRVAAIKRGWRELRVA